MKRIMIMIISTRMTRILRIYADFFRAGGSPLQHGEGQGVRKTGAYELQITNYELTITN
jgi:hypothetical protein